MRKKSLAQIQAQITRLEQQAAEIRAREVADLIARLRADIDQYGLTAADLGLDGESSGTSKRRAATRKADTPATGKPAKAAKARKAASRAGAKAPRAVKTTAIKKATAKASKPAGKIKYSDGQNSWTGVGKRPGWFKAAIDAGKTPEDLLV